MLSTDFVVGTKGFLEHCIEAFGRFAVELAHWIARYGIFAVETLRVRLDAGLIPYFGLSLVSFSGNCLSF